jgi:hypothetical protein
MIAASARRFGLDAGNVVGSIKTRVDAVNFFKQRSSVAAS